MTETTERTVWRLWFVSGEDTLLERGEDGVWRPWMGWDPQLIRECPDGPDGPLWPEGADGEGEPIEGRWVDVDCTPQEHRIETADDVVIGDDQAGDIIRDATEFVQTMIACDFADPYDECFGNLRYDASNWTIGQCVSFLLTVFDDIPDMLDSFMGEYDVEDVANVEQWREWTQTHVDDADHRIDAEANQWWSVPEAVYDRFAKEGALCLALFGQFFVASNN